MMNIYIILITSIILTALFNSEMDTIKHRLQNSWISKPSIIWIQKKILRLSERSMDILYEWYISNNWKGHNWIRKTIFSFTLDGWHWAKGSRVYFISVIIALPIMMDLGINVWYSYLFAIPAYAIEGIFFEIFYNDYIGV